MTRGTAQLTVQLLAAPRVCSGEIRIVRLHAVVEKYGRQVVGEGVRLVRLHVEDRHARFDADPHGAWVEEIGGDVVACQLAADAVERHGREVAAKPADYLSTVFLDDSMEGYDANFTPADARRGQDLYRQLGCAACHQLGTTGGYVGPELSTTGTRLKPGWIAAWLTTPSVYRPGTLQPDYGLSSADARALTAYLSGLGRSGRTTASAGGA